MYRFEQYHRIVHVEYEDHRIYFGCLSMVMYPWVKAKRKHEMIDCNQKSIEAIFNRI